MPTFPSGEDTCSSKPTAVSEEPGHHANASRDSTIPWQSFRGSRWPVHARWEFQGGFLFQRAYTVRSPGKAVRLCARATQACCCSSASCNAKAGSCTSCAPTKAAAGSCAAHANQAVRLCASSKAGCSCCPRASKASCSCASNCSRSEPHQDQFVVRLGTQLDRQLAAELDWLAGLEWLAGIFEVAVVPGSESASGSGPDSSETASGE